MKPFKFTLQPVLTVRQRREQESLEAYARALLERTRALAQLQAAERALSAAQAEWQRTAQEGCRAAEMARHAQHCQALGRRRDDCAALVAAAERKTNVALKAMLAARQQREAVDTFLVKQQLAYDRALTREEQKFLDELAQRRSGNGLAALEERSAL